jgi:hypothetical protein
MTTARKTHRISPHTNYEYAFLGQHGGTLYSIHHYEMLSTAAAQETNITAAWGDGYDLYTHSTRNATPATLHWS